LTLQRGLTTIASLIAVNTAIAGSTSALMSLLLVKVTRNVWDLPSFLNGLLSGLVAITGACAYVKPWAALIIGFVAGSIYYGFVKLERRLKIDDVLDVGPVHAGNGLWGILSIGLFAESEYIQIIYGHSQYSGLFISGNGIQLVAQLSGAVVIIAWGTLWALIFFYLFDHFGHLRIDKEYELRLFEETLTNFKIKSTLEQMAHDYHLMNYVRNVEDESSVTENPMSHSAYIMHIVQKSKN